MKWAIVLYAVMGYASSPQIETVITWNLKFDSYDECASFYRANEVVLHSGVIDHSRKSYNSPNMYVEELGCVHATIVTSIKENPTLTDFQPLYKKRN